jgi:hypothetical protein
LNVAIADPACGCLLPQLIFSLKRYEEVIEAYLAGLEEAAETLPPNAIHAISSVASFFIRYPRAPIRTVVHFCDQTK